MKSDANHVPGPGNYNPQEYPGKRGSYIGLKPKDIDGLHVPGPGVTQLIILDIRTDPLVQGKQISNVFCWKGFP